MHFNRIPIIESELIPETTREPVIELSEDCPVSDEFRKKCNEWYIKMFGYKDVSYAYMSKGNIFMNPKHIVALKLETMIR